ncbi:hypothetical protein [Sphingobium sp. TKS]|uniref:hypothetical protein n=1 Tax=Sphingobium sp. TKS TaxID=1315974 RepID=UPI001F3C2DB0|nr:hypothetical protein [Sphingobium sp. TKS]
MRFGLIRMQAPEQAIHWVTDIHPQMGEDRLLGQQGTRNGPPAPEYRGVAKADIIAKDGSGPDFDEEGDPGPAELFAPQTIDQDDVCLGMIHLDEIEKSFARIFAGVRLMGTSGLRSHGGFGPLAARNFRQQPLDRFLTGDHIGGKPVISVVRVQQTPYLPRHFRARWRDHLERNFVDQHVDASPHRRIDPVRSDNGSTWFWRKRLRDRMRPKPRGQCPYLALFQSGCLGNRRDLGCLHRAGGRYMLSEMRVQRQPRLERFEAASGRRRRLPLYHGMGSTTIFAVAENVAYFVEPRDLQIALPRIACSIAAIRV